MKKTIRNTRSAAWILALLAAATLSGCQKDEPLPPSGNIPVAKSAASSIPHYSDERTFLRTLNSVLSFDSLPQRLAFEAASGRSSAGCRADVLCATIEPATLPDEPAALDFYSHHTALLDTLHLSDGSTAIVPRWYNNPLRYLADSNGLFSVGNTVYRLFKSGVVSSDISLAQPLADLDEESLDNLDNNNFQYRTLSVTSTPVGQGSVTCLPIFPFPMPGEGCNADIEQVSCTLWLEGIGWYTLHTDIAVFHFPAGSIRFVNGVQPLRPAYLAASQTAPTR